MHAVYTVRMSRLRRHALWRQLINDWQQSGVKGKVFCEQQGLRLADLRRWQYRLQKIAKRTDLPMAVNKILSTPVANFLPVEIKAYDTELNTAISLQYCNGFSLQFAKGIDEKVLRKLLRLVAEVKC